MVGKINKTAVLHWFEGRGAKRLAVVINILMVIVVAYVVSGMIWGIIENPLSAINPPKSTFSLGPSDMAEKDRGVAIANLHLFGFKTIKKCERGYVRRNGKCVPKKPVGTNKNTKVEQLRVSLNGIFYNSDPTLARAMIVDSRRQEDSYAVGAPVEGKATVKDILPDQVILLLADNSTQVLKIPEEDIKTASNSRSSKKSSRSSRRDRRNKSDRRDRRSKKKSNEPEMTLAEARAEVMKNPSSINKIVRIAPVSKGKTFIGFRVSPGKQSSLFDGLGLKSGDIVIGVDGVRFNSAQDGMKVASKFASADQLDLMVKRGSSESNVTIRF